MNLKSICRKSQGGCCCKIKTAWEKGSTTETPMQHKNGFDITYFLFLENAKKLGQSDDATWRKKRGWPNSLSF